MRGRDFFLPLRAGLLLPAGFSVVTFFGSGSTSTSLPKDDVSLASSLARLPASLCAKLACREVVGVEARYPVGEVVDAALFVSFVVEGVDDGALGTGGVALGVIN